MAIKTRNKEQPLDDGLEASFKRDMLKHVPDVLRDSAFKKENGKYVHTCTAVSYAVYSELWKRLKG